MAQTATPKRAAREVRFTYKDVKYLIREPSIEETNLADTIRSRAFFRAIEQGVRTEDEIMGSLIDQGRFNEDKYNAKYQDLGAEIRENLINMAEATEEEDIRKFHSKAKRARTKLLNHIRQRQGYTSHSAEQKADNAFNMALTGILTEYADSKGRAVWARYKEDTDELDIDGTYRSVEHPEDPGLLTEALRNFIPFSLGYASTKLPDDPEDLLLAQKLSDTNAKPSVEEIEKAIPEQPAPAPKPTPEPVAEEAPAAVPSTPYDMHVDFASTSEATTPTPAPSKESEEDIDTTRERGGMRMGNEDLVGDASAKPANWKPPVVKKGDAA